MVLHKSYLRSVISMQISFQFNHGFYILTSNNRKNYKYIINIIEHSAPAIKDLSPKAKSMI